MADSRCVSTVLAHGATTVDTQRESANTLSMADDSAVMRIPKITDMPAGEAYAFLNRQISLFGSYRARETDAAVRGQHDRAAEYCKRADAVYEQIVRDVYSLTLGAECWTVAS